MSYQSGRMGMAEGISLVFIATIPTIFLTLPATAIDASGELGWFSVLATSFGTITMLFLLIYVLDRNQGDLLSVSCKLFGQLGAYLIGVYYIIMFLAIATIWLRQYAENTIISTMPSLNFQLSVGWYALGAAFILYYGIEAIARANYVIMPFGIAGLLTVLILLEPLYKPYYLFPWQGKGITDALIKDGILVGSNAGAFLVGVIANSFHNTRVLKVAALWGLGGSVLIKSLAILVFIMVFGTSAAIERSLPFFAMSRLVYLNRYVQRIESIFILLWVMAGIFGIAVNLYMALYLMTRLVNLPTMKPLIPIVTILIMQLAMVPSDMSTVLQIETFMVKGFYNIGIYVIPLLLFVATLFKGKRRAECASG